MTRPLRIEFPGALYHVVTRGHRHESIYEDDADREIFLQVFAEAIERFNWRCYAYCQMTNHYHLLVETPDANLSVGMRYLNGVYTQASNRRHRRTGPLFKGRYSAVLVDPEEYLLAVARYVVLNPVRTGTMKIPGAWPWSSYRATCGDEPAPDWLAVDRVLMRLADDKREAQKRYYLFVLNGVRVKDLWRNVRQQIYLGDEDFVRRVQIYINNPDDPNIPRLQRRSPTRSLDEIAKRSLTRDQAIDWANRTNAYSNSKIARFFGIHPSTVSRVIRRRAAK